MFDKDLFISECRAALRHGDPDRAIRDIVTRTVRTPAEIVRALGHPTRAALLPLHRSPELTVLSVVWAPGMSLLPHDHRLWAVIGVYGGIEDNVFYRRSRQGIAPASTKRMETGSVALLGEPTIHAVSNPSGQFTAAIHVYGGDFFAVPRSEFDPRTFEERPFDVDNARRVFEDANRKPQPIRT